MNINTELFRRYKPENKLEIIKALTQAELLNVTKSTILRIIKEAGKGDSNKVRSKFKTLRLIKRVGNNWNSSIESVYNSKKDEIFLSVYIQGDDTDTTDTCRMDDFLDNRYDTITCGKLHESFRNGYGHTVVANYHREDRAEVIREILSTYVHCKYNIGTSGKINEAMDT